MDKGLLRNGVLIQGFFLQAALCERIGLTNDEWAVIGPLLPAEQGRGCRPAQDNRRYFEGMVWMARTGAQWRHLPDEYGKWNSVFRRYRRWVDHTAASPPSSMPAAMRKAFRSASS